MIPCKIFPNATAARNALNSARGRWTPPVYRNEGGRVFVAHATIGPPVLATDATELVDGRWAVIAFHEDFVGDVLTEAQIKRPVDPSPPGQSAQAGLKAAESGIVERPSAEEPVTKNLKRVAK
jgi:hypothetical protein